MAPKSCSECEDNGELVYSDAARKGLAGKLAAAPAPCTIACTSAEGCGFGDGTPSVLASTGGLAYLVCVNLHVQQLVVPLAAASKIAERNSAQLGGWPVEVPPKQRARSSMDQSIRLRI